MAAVNIIGSVVGWARRAWDGIVGLDQAAIKALQTLWRFVTGVHNLVAWLLGGPQLRYILTVLSYLDTVTLGIYDIRLALRRLAVWVWVTDVYPVWVILNRRLAALRAWAVIQFAALIVLVYRLYFASRAYTQQQVAAERSQRIRADQAEHAAMIKAVKAALATVQAEASSGYNSGLHDRTTLINRLVNMLADRQPEIRGLASRLITAVVDLESIDNPVARFLVSVLLSQLVRRLGVDRVTGDLISRLLGPLTGSARPTTLSGVEHDVGERLSALEAQWADFMDHGGPEVEQAGDEWKSVTGVAADAGILGLFGLAVADPQAFATGISDTIGIAGNDALDAVLRAVRAV